MGDLDDLEVMGVAATSVISEVIGFALTHSARRLRVGPNFLRTARAPSTTLLRARVDLSPASGVGGEVPRNVLVDRRHRDTARPTVAVGSQLASA